MADWMNQMANAVDEAEAANARAQDEVAYRASDHLQGLNLMMVDSRITEMGMKNYSFQASNTVLVQSLRGSTIRFILQ